eukprot:CAMPEP_0172036982 /NCGR_PEP_ID=MMETSP1041-20130122/22473_1 /TAXON_ID=464988 /ORGANISM="Hemiselmis andersenii, Strain CCMP439" /LENGTH=560 /DNA_ID=CAMNT_0012694285 /DNA_START=130 /DNA_END=1812 /DNA_ORIENTATION=+
MASDDGVDSHTAALTGTAVTLVLVCTFGGNLMQRLNNAYWFSSETTLAIFLGFCASMPFCGWKPFDHVFTEEFDTIFFLYLLPPIIFESGYDLNQKDFFRNFAAILSFAVLGTVISTTVMGAGLFSLAQGGMITGINGTSTKEAMKFGSLMSATDPVATLAVLGSLNVEPQLYSLVFGESVLNDAVAIVLFQTVHKLPDSDSFTLTWAQTGKIVATFTGVGLGSIIIGICFGVFAAVVTRKFVRDAHSHSEVTIILSIAYLSFLVSDALGFSGLMTVFFCGVMMSHYAKYNISESGRETCGSVARVLAYLSETVLFIYFGFIILPTLSSACDRQDKYEISWGLFFWTFLLANVARAAHIVPLTLLLNASKRTSAAKRTRISMKSMFVIWFAGLRGAIAFALSLTFDGPNRRYVIPCVVLIILFTNVILGQATAPLLHLLNIRTGVVVGDDDGSGSRRDASYVSSVQPTPSRDRLPPSHPSRDVGRGVADGVSSRGSVNKGARRVEHQEPEDGEGTANHYGERATISIHQPARAHPSDLAEIRRRVRKADTRGEAQAGHGQ